jgi:GT2 family glycosyltransferase
MHYAHHTHHTVLHNTSQQLFTRTSNRGLRKAYELYHPEYLVLMNSDCDLKPGWDTALLRCMEDPDVGLVGYRDSTPEDHREIYQTEPFYNVEHPGYVTGHLLMFRTEALLKTGVFCETDTDGRTFPEIGAHLKGLAHLASDRKLSGDMQLNGFKSVYCNWPGVEHAAGKSWNSSGGKEGGHDLGWLMSLQFQPAWEANDWLV